MFPEQWKYRWNHFTMKSCIFGLEGSWTVNRWNLKCPTFRKLENDDLMEMWKTCGIQTMYINVSSFDNSRNTNSSFLWLQPRKNIFTWLQPRYFLWLPVHYNFITMKNSALFSHNQRKFAWLPGKGNKEP